MSYIEVTEGDCTIRLDAALVTTKGGIRTSHYKIADAERALERLRAAVAAAVVRREEQA